MNVQDLKTPQVKAIIFGLIIAIMLTMFTIPPGFAIVVGILFGFVAFSVLDDHKKER